MAESDATTNTARRSRTRRIDLVTLIAGIATLAVAGYILTDGALIPPGTDPRWLLAGGAVLVGIVLLAGSFRRE